jgi:hypothetical protein
MPEDVSSMLLQGLDTGLSLQDVLLSQIDTSDPTMALVARMIATRSNESASEEESSDEDTDEVTKHRLQRLSRAVRKLQHDCDSLRIEVEELQLRNDTIAAAVGACYLCWGENLGCEVCSGEGIPGRFPINAQAFAEFVLPAVRAFKHQKAPSSTLRREVECESIQ